MPASMKPLVLIPTTASAWKQAVEIVSLTLIIDGDAAAAWPNDCIAECGKINALPLLKLAGCGRTMTLASATALSGSSAEPLKPVPSQRRPRLCR